MTNKAQCSWCRAWIREQGTLPISHGICAPCQARVLADLVAPISDVEQFVEETQRAR